MALAGGLAMSGGVAWAAGPRVSPVGQVPADGRLAAPKDLDGYFPFDPPADRTVWERRAGEVRRRILVSQGMWPMPTRTPMNPVIHGKVEREGYTVEKVYFESRPGCFVTGNLYRPTRVQGKAPGVLFAHGHWTDARLSEAGDAELRRELAEGEERFEEGGRSRFQSMCVQLARMGCVVWQWDMLGNADNQQISMGLAHGFARQRPEMNRDEGWGFFSPQAESRVQSVMGLQTWNAVRSLDFLLSLPEVDADRIAMTGASGGGTQTMLLAAIDPRVALSFPAVMVSTAMQGGCTCENASLLRVGTGNVEFAGLFAPKPQGMTTANDWTRELSTKGFPALQRLYALLGAPDRVMLKRGEHFPHNYNAVSRSAFYGWLNRHFKLGQTDPVIEQDYQRLQREEMTVWDAAHPAPRAADPEFERALLRQWHDDDQKRLAEESATAAGFTTTYGRAWDVILDGDIGGIGTVEWEMTGKEDRGDWIEMKGWMKGAQRKQQLPAVYLYPKQWNGRTTIWLSEQGKDGLYGADGSLMPAVRQLMQAGRTVVGVDLLHQGEFLRDGEALKETPKVKNPREAGAYTFGYNPTVFAERVQDVLAVIRYVRDHERRSSRIDLVALDGTAPVATAARAQARGAVGRAVLGLGAFSFSSLRDLRHPDFAPGAAKYGDVDGLLALAAPGATLVFGRSEQGSLATREYARAVGARPEALRWSGVTGTDEMSGAAAVYLLEP